MKNNNVNPWIPIIILIISFLFYSLVVKLSFDRFSEKSVLPGGPNSQPVTELQVDNNQLIQ